MDLLSQRGAMGENLQRTIEELFEADLTASRTPPRVGLALSPDRVLSVA